MTQHVVIPAGYLAWREKYAKENDESGERWITLNGGSGDDGHGGTPVKIDGNGNIVAGPKGLKDKGIEHVDHFAGQGKAKENAAKSKAAGEAQGEGEKAISEMTEKEVREELKITQSKISFIARTMPVGEVTPKDKEWEPLHQRQRELNKRLAEHTLAADKEKIAAEQKSRDAYNDREEARKKALPIKNMKNGWEVATDGARWYLRDPHTKEIIYDGSRKRVNEVAMESKPDIPPDLAAKHGKKAEEKQAAEAKASGENKPAPTQVSSPSQQEPPTAKQERKSENSKKNRAVEIEKDDEGKSRGVITLPNGEKFNGKWREGQFSEQDLKELAFKDFVNKQNLDLGQTKHNTASDYGESARKMKHYINEVANSVFRRPKNRPEHVAEYVEFSGDTRKYRIQPKWDSISGLHWVGVYDNDAQGMKSYEVTPKHESYDDAAFDLGQHFDGLRGKGDLKIHDDVSQKAVKQREESRTKQAREEEDRAAKQRAEEAETNKANQMARGFIDSQISGVKGSKKRYDINMSGNTSSSVSGTVYGPFGVHKDGNEYKVTHLGSGFSIGSYKTEKDAKAAAILTGKRGKWDFSDHKSIDNDTARFGITIAKALKVGALHKIKQAFDEMDSQGGSTKYALSLSPKVHAGFLAWKEKYGKS